MMKTSNQDQVMNLSTRLYFFRFKPIAMFLFALLLTGPQLALAQSKVPLPADMDPAGWHLETAKNYPLLLDEPFKPNMESLEHYQVPEWYRDAKFGIFIHWGVFSVPAYGSEWYEYFMYRPKDEVPKQWRDLIYGTVYDHHLKTYGDPKTFGYKDFIPMFKAEKYDPQAWAELFKDAGAKYIMAVSEFHDGFPMYDSTYTDWNVTKMGPKRDVYGELEKDVHALGIKFGVSSHRAFHWRFVPVKDKYDTGNPKYVGLYGPTRDNNGPPSKEFLADEFGRSIELINVFHPDLLWFDAGIDDPAFKTYRMEIAADYYNQAAARGQEVVLNYKGNAYPTGAAVLDLENVRFDGMRQHFWQTDDSINGNWGYKTDNTYRDSTSVIHELVDIVSKNGCLLLNGGPRADGTFPIQIVIAYREIGAWLKVNGEAIYATRPYQVYGEGPAETATAKTEAAVAVRYTMNKAHDTLYAILLDWPTRDLSLYRVKIEHAAPDAKVELFGYDHPLAYHVEDGRLTIMLPKEKPVKLVSAYALKLTGFTFGQVPTPPPSEGTLHP